MGEVRLGGVVRGLRGRNGVGGVCVPCFMSLQCVLFTLGLA